MRLITIYIIIFSFCACQQKLADIDSFYGDIIVTDRQKVEVDSLVGTLIPLYDIQTGDMYPFDSLGVFVSNKFPQYNIQIYNLNTFSHVGQFCKIGQGPNETKQIARTIQYIYADGQLKYWLYSFNDKRMMLLNISESIRLNKTIYDSIVDLNWMTKPFNYIFMLNDNVLLTKSSNYDSFDEDKIVYRESNLKGENEPAKIYDIFNIVDSPNADPGQLDIVYASMDVLKLDNCKIAMGMYFLGQINILDLKSGILKGIRIKNTPDFDHLQQPIEELNIFNISISASDNYIYSLYSNGEVQNILDDELGYSNEILVFDWDGNLIRRIILDHQVCRIKIDPSSNFLYATNEKDETFVYRPSQVYKSY